MGLEAGVGEAGVGAGVLVGVGAVVEAVVGVVVEAVVEVVVGLEAGVGAWM